MKIQQGKAAGKLTPDQITKINKMSPKNPSFIPDPKSPGNFILNTKGPLAD